SPVRGVMRVARLKANRMPGRFCLPRGRCGPGTGDRVVSAGQGISSLYPRGGDSQIPNPPGFGGCGPLPAHHLPVPCRVAIRYDERNFKGENIMSGEADFVRRWGKLPREQFELELRQAIKNGLPALVAELEQVLAADGGPLRNCIVDDFQVTST